ncbi:hypothetical protein OQA88_5149 [Cercophora sp. LCS_1]
MADDDQWAGFVTDDPVINAESQSGTIWAICIAFSIGSIVFLGLRLYTRFTLLRCAGPDDYTIIIAELFALLTALGASMEARHGLGRHSWTISADDIFEQMKWLYFKIIVYNTCTNLIKVSFLLQFRRLFIGEKTQRVCNYGLIFIGIWTVVQILILSLSCLPLTAIVPSMKDRCLPVDPTWFLSSAMNIVTDFAIFLIPIPSLISLRTSNRRQKALLLLVFGLGFFVCIISIIRISYLSLRTRSKDSFWTSPTPVNWSIVELHCGVICSCLATLRPFLRKVFPWLHIGNSERDTALSFELKYKKSNMAGRSKQGDKKKLSKAQGSKTGAGPRCSESTEALRDTAEQALGEGERV